MERHLPTTPTAGASTKRNAPRQRASITMAPESLRGRYINEFIARFKYMSLTALGPNDLKGRRRDGCRTTAAGFVKRWRES
jgi:hypothetical protein